jgi:serine/threonine-protein kinase
MRHVEEEVPPPSRVADGIPIQLDEIVVRATRRDPWARPRDAAGLLGQIQATREDVAALAGPTQAIAHPTVAVSPVRRGDPRPARLPEQRASGRAGAGMGARVQGTEPPPDLGERMRDGISGFGGWLRVTADRLRYTARGRRQLTAGLVVLALVILGGGYWLAFGRYTQAPDLTQLTRDSAELEAKLKGFDITIGESLFSEVVEPGRVLGQQPPPGGRIVRGGTITLFLSKGPDRRAIPDVTGQELEFALTRLCGETTGPGQCQFVIEQVDGFSDTLPLGYVAGTDPPAGTMLAPGDRIKVIVVTGPFPMHVPGVLGDTLENAINTLNAAGFTNVVVEQRASDEPKDRVLDQTPPAETGVEQAAGVQVTLVVSLGPALPMPNFIEPPRDCQEALNELAALGVIGHTTEPAPGGAFVTAQSVQPGAALTVGQTVELTCVH